MIEMRIKAREREREKESEETGKRRRYGEKTEKNNIQENNNRTSRTSSSS